MSWGSLWWPEKTPPSEHRLLVQTEALSPGRRCGRVLAPRAWAAQPGTWCGAPAHVSYRGNRLKFSDRKEIYEGPVFRFGFLSFIRH